MWCCVALNVATDEESTGPFGFCSGEDFCPAEAVCTEGRQGYFGAAAEGVYHTSASLRSRMEPWKPERVSTG